MRVQQALFAKDFNTLDRVQDLIAEKKGIIRLDQKIESIEKKLVEQREIRQKEYEKNEMPFKRHWWKFWKPRIRFAKNNEYVRLLRTEKFDVDVDPYTYCSLKLTNASIEDSEASKKIYELVQEKINVEKQKKELMKELYPDSFEIANQIRGMHVYSLRNLGFYVCHLQQKYGVRNDLEAAPILAGLVERNLIRTDSMECFFDFPSNAYVTTLFQIKDKYPGKDKIKTDYVWAPAFFVIEHQKYFPVLFENLKKLYPKEVPSRE